MHSNFVGSLHATIGKTQFDLALGVIVDGDEVLLPDVAQDLFGNSDTLGFWEPVAQMFRQIGVNIKTLFIEHYICARSELLDKLVNKARSSFVFVHKIYFRRWAKTFTTFLA